MPLLGIPSLLSPELLKCLAEMGHGDTLVLADAHFPSHSIARKASCSVIRYDGVEMPQLLEAIMSVLPIDTYIESPIALMQVEPSDADKFSSNPPIWSDYAKVHPHFNLLTSSSGKSRVQLLPREQFYRAAERAYCVVHTGELAQYANIIITKGVAI
uniref:L-fucose mutarotase n=2 Tax=Macrostomum lignano TaxID=282301 RepID=A0A1I8GQ48_9PLAT